jgi:hypothetical protein
LLLFIRNQTKSFIKKRLGKVHHARHQSDAGPGWGMKSVALHELLPIGQTAKRIQSNPTHGKTQPSVDRN